MKVYLSTARTLKSNHPVYKDWESAMIEIYGTGILSKTKEIWELILRKEKEQTYMSEFDFDAIKYKKRFNDYYKWQNVLIQKYGETVTDKLYTLWVELKEKEMLLNNERIKKEKAANILENIKEKYTTIFWFKIVSVIFLALSYLSLPYVFYTFLRIIVFGTAMSSLFIYYNENKKFWLGIFGAIALIFNPIIPIHLNKQTWGVVDGITIFIILISIFIIKEIKIISKR